MKWHVNEVEKKVIKDFKSYLTEEAKEVYFTFGRMNPPTIGHGKVLDTIAKKASGADWKVYVSQSVGPKDPLSYSDKVKHLRKMLPKYGRNIMVDKGVKNVFDIAAKLYDQGYKRITMVVGEDRLREFDVLLNKYNGKKARHGFYNFESIRVVSAGRRDPDAEGVEGMSASKQRANAKDNDYTAFTQGVPKSMSDRDTRKLFNDVRKGLGLKEETSFQRHIALPKVSDIREQFVKGELFELGDTVVIKESEEVGMVSVLGSNYVIVECGDKKVRKWLDAVELVEKKAVQDPDIKDKEGTQPKKYYAGLKKGTKDKRDAHFKKHGKKADDDDSAYKPAPGDKTAKTKPSKYTKQFKDMYEEVSQKELSDLEKFADRLLNKFDVDIEFTKHFADRMNDKRNKPAITIAELQRLFKKMAQNKGKKIKKHGNKEAILKDMQSDLNLPVVINWKNGEFEVVNKTIMRKKAFKSPDPEVKYEGAGEEGTDKLVKKYKKDTPMQTEAFGKYIDFNDPVFGKILDKFANADVYKRVIRKYLDVRRKNPKQGQKLMTQISREYGLSPRKVQDAFFRMIDKGALPKHLDWSNRLKASVEEDAVQDAKARIKREKEQDKKKHDSLLDRARLARARTKNRKTK